MTTVTWRVEHLEHVDSTNTWLAARARAGAPEGTAVRADFQSAGRGRLGREWVARAGSSLLCSVLLDTGSSSGAPQLFVLACALSMAEVLERSTTVRPALKWPNDILFAESKVAGLLAEVVGDQVVVGLGVNLSEVDPEYPAATTVLAATGVTLGASDLFADYLTSLARRRALLDSPAGVAALREEYVRSLSTLGRAVRAELAREVVHGVAVDVDETGALVIDTGRERRVVTAGDVVHLRREEES